MATMLLRTAGGLLGSMIGGPFGAILGATGAMLGHGIDQKLFGSDKVREGPRLNQMPMLNASEGAAIARVYGTIRVGGQLIWSTRLREVQSTSNVGGGKGMPTGGAKVREFEYYANVAIAVCEGTIAGIRRVWIDGRELDLSKVEYRVYDGAEDQQPDPLIQSIQGEGKAPAYRGTAYVVFENLSLEEFGNRIPQFSFEVMRPVGALERDLQAVCLIPGAGEFTYSPEPILETQISGESTLHGKNVLHSHSDWAASLDELQALCPNLKHVALVVSWFGDNLACENCTIEPRVETLQRGTVAKPWQVAGLTRSQARLITYQDEAPAIGGTPSDWSVVEAITDLKARGLSVTLYPFIMMDIAPDNGLVDPYGDVEQTPYPWRGKITSLNDRTAQLPAAVDGFFEGHVDARFGYRDFVLHYAKLASEAGGVDAFLLGSELRGLTRLRDEADHFPFVDRLQELATQVRALVGDETALTYAADWSEYSGYQPADGSGDVFFNLDPLWAHPEINAIGIDNYMPLSDWRGDPTSELDGFKTAHDKQALRAQIQTGEGFDYYYASASDRQAQIRMPIGAGDGGDEWLYRFKDVAGWWSNEHRERRNGVSVIEASVWVPRSKPIWFTELGAPAVDKAANQPNVFPDPKSSDSELPYFSSGNRDDLAQRRFIEAHLEYWGEQANDIEPMVDPERIYAWCWDTRPNPAFPQKKNVWRDTDNWRTGHWLNGRLGSVSADSLLKQMAKDQKLDGVSAELADGICRGLLVPGDSNFRDNVEAVMELFGLVARQNGTQLEVRSQDWSAEPSFILQEDLVVENGDADEQLVTATRADVQDSPSKYVLSYHDVQRAYEPASVIAHYSGGHDTNNDRIGKLSLGVALNADLARSLADAALTRNWRQRTSVSFNLAHEHNQLELGDIVRLEGFEQLGEAQITSMHRGDYLSITAVSIGRFENCLSGASSTMEMTIDYQNTSAPKPVFEVLDLPILPAITWASGYGAVSVPSWRTGFGIYASRSKDGFTRRNSAFRNAITGSLLNTLEPAQPYLLNHSQSLNVQLIHGELNSLDTEELLAGGNAIAVCSNDGSWEIVQFQFAQMVGKNQWRLSGLLRAQQGTEKQMISGADVGAKIVLLDAALVSLDVTEAERGVELNWIAAAAGEALSSELSTQTQSAVGIRQLQPLSPVHLKVRLEGGLVSANWIRRDRINADNWMAEDVPMSEAQELYRVSWLDSTGQTISSFDVTQSYFENVTPAPNAASMEVAQISRAVGAGPAAHAAIN